MTPRGIEKAEALSRHAAYLGALRETFVVPLTPDEAAELLDWYAADYAGQSELFDADLVIARRSGDPWPILSQFQIMGFTPVPQQ